MERRLRRSGKERVFLGVLGGIAEYLDLDPTVVRIGFVVLLVYAPVTMTLLYFLMALVMPEEGFPEKPLDVRINEIAAETRKIFSKTSEDGHMRTLASIMLITGAAILVRPFLPRFPFTSGDSQVALLLVIIGTILIFRGD
ncbi:PspC domain-containing protein [Thermococcus sp.]